MWDNTALIAYFRRNLKHNIKKNLIYYKEGFDGLNSLIEPIIKLDNKIYKLAIKIYYSNFNSQAEF